MKELQRIKPIAEQFFALSVELLEAIDADEQDCARFIGQVKKTAVKLYSFRKSRTRRT